MDRVQTIQKLSEDVGIDPSSIQGMINRGELTKYHKPGFARVFVDPDEFYALIEKVNNSDDSISFDLESFLVS